MAAAREGKVACVRVSQVTVAQPVDRAEIAAAVVRRGFIFIP